MAAERSRKIVGAAMREVFEHEPSTVERAKVSGARKRRMRIAIALSKAREAGAKVPKQA